MSTKAVFVRIDDCSRCGKVHSRLKLRQLKRATRVNGVVLSHWLLCPTRKEPIFATTTRSTRRKRATDGGGGVHIESDGLGLP